MPTAMSYDEATRTLQLGEGTWGPVTPAVWSYSVGGKNVLKSWFNYRKAHPGGKKTSPLDHIHVDAWPHEWTAELIDLLIVLSRLVALEPAQPDLLDRVLAGPLATRHSLRDHAAGGRLPRATALHDSVRSSRPLARGSSASAPTAVADPQGRRRLSNAFVMRMSWVRFPQAAHVSAARRVSRCLGHATTVTETRYVHLLDEADRRTVKAMQHAFREIRRLAYT
ncbi:MAG: hypothetical protein H7Y15_08955 [Pseudonocardia sp.]|nr:hypothetical protein [Pseudonocardia sp.]